jgi:methionyl-tRNA formyltransferase
MPELPPIHFLTGFDKSELLESLLNFGLQITYVVLPDSEKYLKLSSNVFELATEHRIQTVRVSASDWSNLAKVSATDSILLSARFPFKIPRQIFERYRHALNIHPTLLPKYRGRYLEPILVAGDEESGVTLHVIDDDYDTGAIVHQMRFSVGTFDTVSTLLRKAGMLEASLVLRGMQLLSDEAFSPLPQDSDQASSLFEKRTPADSYVPSSTSLFEALKIVRASNVVTHPAFTLIDGQKVIIEMRRPDKPTNEFDCI